MPADAASTCSGRSSRARPSTCWPRSSSRSSKTHDVAPRRKVERSRACQTPNGITSAKPHRLISALMRFGPSRAGQQLADDDIESPRSRPRRTAARCRGPSCEPARRRGGSARPARCRRPRRRCRSATRVPIRSRRKTRDRIATDRRERRHDHAGRERRAHRDAEQHADREQEVAEERLDEQQPARRAASAPAFVGRRAHPADHRDGGDPEAQPGQQEDREHRDQDLRQPDVGADDRHAGGQAEYAVQRARQRTGRAVMPVPSRARRAPAVTWRGRRDVLAARWRSCRAISQLATITPIETTSTISVATALTLGLRPSRAREKMTSGIVVAPGPDRKADSTTSSSDSVKVSSQADSSACAIIGRVTRWKTSHGRAPRSIAASSSCALRSAGAPARRRSRRPCRAAGGRARSSPCRARESRARCCTRSTSISSSDRPMITSGITSGAATMPANSVRPSKRRYGPARTPPACRARPTTSR